MIFGDHSAFGDGTAAVEDYVLGFRERIHAMWQPGLEILDGPGIVGLIGRGGDTLEGRVLVTDDRALDLLARRLPRLFARVTYVFDEAGGCRRLLSEAGSYRATRCTAMVCDDLGAIPELPLPAGLRLRAVRAGDHGGDDAGDDGRVALVDAAVAALRSDPEMAPTANLADFVGYLRSVPSTRYLAAVDEDGVVRATAAAATWASTAGVFFVNTDPAWRGRGVGTAMTAAALRKAATDGAERACLDASDLGRSIYLRLGFEPVGGITQFVQEG